MLIERERGERESKRERERTAYNIYLRLEFSIV